MESIKKNAAKNVFTATGRTAQNIDPSGIKAMLKQNAPEIKLFFSACIHCSYCADTCFLQRNNPDDPTYMPSYKVIHSVGKLYKKKGKVTFEELEEIQDLLWVKCALCTRCVCPMQLNIPGMIALGRDICRSQGAGPRFDGLFPPVELPSNAHEVAR
ncbi:(Fe-S)-binding protein [uncultured Desulfobacter sp.]|uniref:(Fe-S)-binding protein n=1 Tax=uncultured Desulfobacter sp. TaxID=240139 RepID=UPI0029F4D881|nr:(Fe-S)-binding protein [uncultured Desulfobacter sp.]